MQPNSAPVRRNCCRSCSLLFIAWSSEDHNARKRYIVYIFLVHTKSVKNVYFFNRFMKCGNLHMFNIIFLNSFQWEETRGSIFWLHIKKFTKKGKRSYPCMLNLLNQSQAKKVPHELWFCDCPYKSTLKWTSHLSAWNN